MDDRYLRYLKEDDQLWGIEGMQNDPINQQPQQQNDPINDPINNLGVTKINHFIHLRKDYCYEIY